MKPDGALLPELRAGFTLAKRCKVHSEKGWPTARGRRRTSSSNRARYAGVVLLTPPGRGASSSPATPSAWYRRSQRRTVCSAVPGQLAGGSSSVPTESREESEVVDLQGVGRTDAGAAS